jgi:hypothetical protein
VLSKPNQENSVKTQKQTNSVTGRAMEAAETLYEVAEASVTATAHLHFKDRGPMPNSLLAILRRLGTDFLAFFRFTEADARALLSAYGLNALEIDGPQKGSNEQKKAGESLGAVSRHRICEPPRPIPIGVHPDFARANWTL